MIITVEEHLLSGGFSSFLLECGIKSIPVSLNPQVCYSVGSQDYLSKVGGLGDFIQKMDKR